MNRPVTQNVAAALAIALIALPGLTVAQTAAPQAAAPKAAAPAAAAQDIGWPRQIAKNGATLVYYQPQLDEWKNYKKLSGRMAFSLTPAGGQQALGVVSLEADTIVDRDARTVFLRDVDVKSIRFPSLDEKAAKPLESSVHDMLPKGGETISLDRLMAEIEKDKVPAQPVAVRNDPPPIFYSAKPAVLLIVDGEPALNPIDGTGLQSVINANWDLFVEKATKRAYLLLNTGWLTANDLKGPWTAATTLPPDMAKLPAGQNWDDVKKMVPPPPATAPAPQVFYSNAPAELLLMRGAPVYTAIAGTRLLYVANTDNDVFLDNTDRQFYVLLSGRWFKSAALEGPWTYAGGALPADFAKIPEASAKGRVLASVPGTQQAADAVMLAQVPTTAVITKAQAEAKAKVTYDGQPQFKPIEQTTLQYATNTQERVIKDGDIYYLCFQGVWFMSTKPDGPWKTADIVPPEIYTIPPSSPVYNVTYVTQTNATATTVEASHTAGYLGMFVIGAAVGATICYGTGFYYPPYFYYPPGGFYPIYRPWPVTYGAAAVWNPRTGGFAVGRAAYGPYGAAGGSAWYNPATGRYGRSASVQDWYGGRTSASSYNPWTGSYARTNQGHNAYSQWGSSVATRGNQWVQTGHVTTAGGTTAGYRTSGGQAGVVTHGANGTIAHTTNGTYAGHDGNVYRRNGAGDWSQFSNGGWNNVDRSTVQSQRLEQSHTSRQRGQVNTQRNRPVGRSRGGGFRRR